MLSLILLAAGLAQSGLASPGPCNPAGEWPITALDVQRVIPDGPLAIEKWALSATGQACAVACPALPDVSNLEFAGYAAWDCKVDFPVEGGCWRAQVCLPKP